MRKPLLPLFLFVTAATLLTGQIRHVGEINGAAYIVDVPSSPNGQVLFIARGYRPEFFPLSAVYEVETPFYQTLLAEGWTLASTSFQHNDWVIEEGGRDLLALRNWLATSIHPIERAVLYGETMGGGVALWLAENEGNAFAGVFALGAQLNQGAPALPGADSAQAQLATAFSGKPTIPVILVANTEEAACSFRYQAQAKAAAPQAQPHPAIWQIHRTGHVNVNSAERLAALRALIAAIEGGSLPSREDATLELHPHSVAAHFQNTTAGTIRRLRPLYGNIYTNFVPEDLTQIGVTIGDRFTMTKGTETHPITYAKAYSDVPYGEWVAFVDAEGYLQISRNYANAAETIAAKPGDPLILARH